MSLQFYHEPTSDVLIYEEPDNARMLTCIPEARPVVNGYVGVPMSLWNLQMLRWLGKPVPQIMDWAGYDWPHHGSIPGPTAAQKAMANFCVLHPHCFNLSDMGTMKTLASLWAADFVMQHYPPGACRCLISAPLTILQRVWGDAIFKHFLGRRTFQIVHGTTDKREKALATPADFYIINHDGLKVGAKRGGKRRLELKGFSATLAARTDIRIAIIDEASGFRDARTDRHKAAQQLMIPRDYLWLVTGSPTPNGPVDAYGLAKLVNNANGERYTDFHARVMERLGTFKFVPRRGAYVEARKLLQPAIRFDIKEVWDGPPLTTQPRDVPLSSEQAKHLKELKRQFQIVLASGYAITAMNEAAVRLKLLQICLGEIYDQNHVAHHIDCAPRLQDLEEVIENADRKLLCFAPFTSIVGMLYKHLSKRWTCAMITGAVPEQQRAEIIRRFALPDGERIIIADPGCVAYGINEFVVADTAIWYGPTDKTDVYDQANKRLHRPGQKWPVSIVQMTSTPTEREIFKRLESNQSMQGLMLDMVRNQQL